jgi:hypothetical protein
MMPALDKDEDEGWTVLDTAGTEHHEAVALWHDSKRLRQRLSDMAQAQTLHRAHARNARVQELANDPALRRAAANAEGELKLQDQIV